MKILVICRPLVFHGGVERATAGFLAGLVAHGDEVHLLTPGRDPALPGVTYHRLVLPPAPPPLRPLAWLAAVRVMRGRSWDVVQSHERTLGQDVYRAGEGCHRAWLAASGAHCLWVREDGRTGGSLAATGRTDPPAAAGAAAVS